MNIFGENYYKKKRFLILGLINFLITNITLQFLLLILPIYVSTIASQIINLFLGFYLYGNKVFQVKKKTLRIFIKYLFLAFVLWVLNFSSIKILFNLGINKNIAAFLVIPFLVILSYFCQSRYVFK